MDVSIVEESARNQQMAIKQQEDEDGISVPNWLIDVLKWITRIEMANSSLSYSCRMFKQLCWPKLHEEVKPHMVPYLQFYDDVDAFGNINGTLANGNGQQIQIAAIQQPEYILGFKEITIGFVDNQVIEFAKNIVKGKITFTVQKFMLLEWEENDGRLALVGRLLTQLANDIDEMRFTNIDENSFYEFYRLFPDILDQVPFFYIPNLFDFDFEILFNWLMKPKADGGQKIVFYYILQPEANHQEMEARFISRIEEEFANSTKATNFLVVLRFEYENFSRKNEFTGEVLNLFIENGSDGSTYHFLARYPEGEEKQWKNGNIEKISEKENMSNIILDIQREMEDMKNNKLDTDKSSKDLTISNGNLAVASSSSANGFNSVQAEMKVKLHYRLEKYIACYFEVKILNHWDIGIGFSDEDFLLEYDFCSSSQSSRYIKNRASIEFCNLGVLNNSMGFWCKEGVHIKGKFKTFDKVVESNELFRQGDVIGCGLIHNRHSSLEFFATHNGILLGLIELPQKLHRFEYFPTITLASPSASVRPNFGKEAFCFDRSKLFNEKPQDDYD